MNRKIIKLMFVFTAMAASVALGAEDGVDPEKKTTLWGMIMNGGPFMVPLGLFSVLMIYFIVQNFLALREKVLLRPDLMPGFIQLMKDNRPVGIGLCIGF